MIHEMRKENFLAVPQKGDFSLRLNLWREGYSKPPISPLVQTVVHDKANKKIIRDTIGMRNDSNGLEIYFLLSGQPTVTCGEYGITQLRRSEDSRTSVGLLFWDFLGYLNYINFGKKLERLVAGDCIILNSPRNISEFINVSKSYRKLYTFFPDNEAGTILSMTLMDYTTTLNYNGQMSILENLRIKKINGYQTK